MKNVLLLINHADPPYGDFAGMFQSITKTSGQFTVEVTSDRNSLCNLDAYDAVALYILGGDMTPNRSMASPHSPSMAGAFSASTGRTLF